MARAILANSSGWMVNEPSRIWILAPVPTSLIDAGSSAGSATSKIPMPPRV